MSPPSYEYDVYLSYNVKDVEAVDLITARLRAAGVKVWRWEVDGGNDMTEPIRASLDRSACSAVFVGANGLGPFQSREVMVNILGVVESSGGAFGVLTVLLPGAIPDSLPSFLRDKHRVDFRAGLEDEEAFGLLLKSIRDAPMVGAETARGLGADGDGEEELSPNGGDAPTQETTSTHSDWSSTFQEGDGDSAQAQDGQETDIHLGELAKTFELFKMGDEEQQSIRIAGTIGNKIDRPVDSTIFMAAMLGASPNISSHSAFSFLNDLVSQRLSRAVSSPSADAALSLGLTEYDLLELPSAYSDEWNTSDVAEELGGFIGRAAELAKKPGLGEGTIRVRHFVGAVLAPSAEASPPTVLQQLKRLDYNIGGLRVGFLNHIRTVYPASSEAWEKVINPAPVGGPKPPAGGDGLPLEPPAPATPVEPPSPEEVERESIRRASVSDQPTDEDSLGFSPYVKAVAGFLSDERTLPPLTLSIEGEWGSGKSSFMLQLRKELCAVADERRREVERRYEEDLRASAFDPSASPLLWLWKFHPLMKRLRLRRRTRALRCLTVEFNPWRHDKEDALWASFALEFVEKLSKVMTRGERMVAHFKLLHRRFKWRDGWLVALRMAFLIIIIGAMVVALVSLLRVQGLPAWAAAVGGEDKGAGLFRVIQASGAAGYVAVMLYFLSKFREFVGNPFAFDIRKYVEAPDYEGRVAFIEQFHEDFQKIVETYAGEKNKVYVFIDDLDRCDVPKAADLMQAINLMVSGGAPQLIFVIGMDREKVAAGLAVKNEKLLPYLAPRRAAADAQAAPARAQTSPDIAFGIEYGYNFIEKFIQIPFSVPQPARMGVRKLLKYIDPLVEPPSDGKRAEANGGGSKPDKGFAAKTNGSSGGSAPADAPSDQKEDKQDSRKDDRKVEAKGDEKDKEEQVQQATDIVAQSSPGGWVEVARQDAPEDEEDDDEASEGGQHEGVTVDILGDSDRVRKIVLMVAHSLDFNPRRIKQFVNVFRLKAHIAYETELFRTRVGAQRLTLEQLGKFVAIVVRWPRFLAELDEERTLLGEMQRLATVKDYESASQSAHEWLLRPEMRSLLEFGCDPKQPDPFDKSKPANVRRYTLADIAVDRLLQVSPRARRSPPAATPPPTTTTNGAPTANATPAPGAPEKKSAPESRPKVA